MPGLQKQVLDSIKERWKNDQDVPKDGTWDYLAD